MFNKNHRYNEFPGVVSGYELGPYYGYFTVVIPEGTTNMIERPSFEDGTSTNYTALGGATIAITTDWQAYGAYGARITPVASTESGIYYSYGVTLISGTTYTGSAFIQGERDKTYYIWFATAAGALIGSKRKWVGTGIKQRIHVTYTETATAARRLYVSRDGSYSDITPFYADAFQVEAKAYPTTYCDGDQVGYIIDKVDYAWNGSRYASSSFRSAQTRSGGREYNLTEYNLHVLDVVGLGMTPIVDQSIPIPGYGEYAVGTGTAARIFTLVGALVSSGNNPRYLQYLRQNLIEALSPDLTAFDQPILLRYQAFDEDGYPVSNSLDIVCKYQSGLEGNWDNDQQERLALDFKMHLPYLQESYSRGVALGFLDSLTNFADIGYRDIDGQWKPMGTGTGVAAAIVRVILPGPDGSVYVGGSFSAMGGVADTVALAKWDGSAWTSIGVFPALSAVWAMAFDAAGNLYVGGDFANADGVANTLNIAKWDGSVWTPLGTGANSIVRAIAIDSSGILYAGGEFTLAGGVANTSRIAAWSGTVWSPLGTGAADQYVAAMAIDRGDNLYAVGEFTQMGGIFNTAKVARWNGTVWISVGGATGVPLAIVVAADGLVYMGGNITAAGGTTTNYIAVWHGTAWQPLSSEVNGIVQGFTPTANGDIYVYGQFGMAGDIPLADSIAILRNGAWIPLDINIADAGAVFYVAAVDKVGRLYLGGSWSGGIAYSASVDVPDIGGFRAYPIITMTGPGSVYQLKNYITGRAIYFKDLTLVAGETAVLDLRPEQISFESPYRGNLMKYILPGSDLDFFLSSGSNNVSMFMLGTTAASKIIATWNALHQSIDGAVL